MVVEEILVISLPFAFASSRRNLSVNTKHTANHHALTRVVQYARACAFARGVVCGCLRACVCTYTVPTQWYCAVLCCVVLCCAVLCCTVLHCSALCVYCAVLCCAALRCAALCVVCCAAVLTVLHCTVLCCAELYCAVLCCDMLCCGRLCYAVLCGAMLCCAVLCCAVLCCDVLCCAGARLYLRKRGDVCFNSPVDCGSHFVGVVALQRIHKQDAWCKIGSFGHLLLRFVNRARITYNRHTPMKTDIGECKQNTHTNQTSGGDERQTHVSHDLTLSRSE